MVISKERAIKNSKPREEGVFQALKVQITRMGRKYAINHLVLMTT